jgi:uncharacterized membrane protein
LGDTTIPAKKTPDWELLLAHHFPGRYARTFAVPWRSRTIHLCARCTGQLAGFCGFVLTYFLSPPFPFGLFAPVTQLAIAFAPLAAAIDWLTQTLGRQESTNVRRVASGALLGVAWGDAAALLLTGRWILLAGVGVVAGIYVVTVFLVLLLSGGWRRALDEHFPGWERRA